MGFTTERKIGLIALALIGTIPFTIAGGATLLASSAQDETVALQKTLEPVLKAEREARNAEALRRALRPLLGPPQIGAVIEDLAATLPMTDHVQAVERSPAGDIQFIAEAADTDALDAALDDSERLKDRETLDVAPADAGRMRVTYKVRYP